MIENWPSILIQDWKKWAQIGVITRRRFIFFQPSKKFGSFEKRYILNPSTNLTVQFNATHSIITTKNVYVKQLLGRLFVYSETLCVWNIDDTAENTNQSISLRSDAQWRSRDPSNNSSSVLLIVVKGDAVLCMRTQKPKSHFHTEGVQLYIIFFICSKD